MLFWQGLLVTRQCCAEVLRAIVEPDKIRDVSASKPRIFNGKLVFWTAI
jgi:hypothetical protein